MNTKEDWEIEFDELMFATCPTETKEPFFWKWSDHGKEILFDFIRKIRAEAVRENVGMLRQWLNEDRIIDPKKMVTNEDLLHWLEWGTRTSSESEKDV